MGGKPAGYSSGVRELISTEIGQKDPLLGQNAGGSNLNVDSREKTTKNNDKQYLEASTLLGRLECQKGNIEAALIVFEGT